MFEEIKNRNYKLIEQYLKEYNITHEADELVNLASIYISVEEKANRMRIIGNHKSPEKTKKVQIKTFQMKYIDDNALDGLKYHLNFFLKLIEEIKMIKTIESIESEYKGILSKHSIITL